MAESNSQPAEEKDTGLQFTQAELDEFENIEDPKERSKAQAAAFTKKLKATKQFDPKEKKILELYNKGVQNFEIARQVFDGMVNSDTVGKVVLTIRKVHADDFSDIEDIESTRGYSGVANNGQGQII